MAVRRRKILEVCRPHPISTVAPTDFVTEDNGEIPVDEVLRDPRYSLYCFDLDRGLAVFVECEDLDAVDRAPFYYQGQAENAIATVEVPLETFHRIAGEIPSPAKGFIFVHSTGRCGSTLISKVLASIPSVHSLSEPDDLTQLVRLRVGDGVSVDLIRDLVVSSIRWRAKSRRGDPAAQVAIKTRSEVIVLADLIGPAFLDAKHFFLYRNAIAWVGTLFRAWPEDRKLDDVDKNRQMGSNWARMLPLVRDYLNSGLPPSPIAIRLLAWITCMEGYLALRDMGVPVAAVRFEQITANPSGAVDSFLSYCGIHDADPASIQDVLSRDSRAGTIYDREELKKYRRELTPEMIEEICALVAGWPSLRNPDVILPGTLDLS